MIRLDKYFNGHGFRSPREVQAQLLEIVRQIATHDFPEPWNTLLPEALACVAGGDPSRIYGSLQVLRKVASSLEFSSGHASNMQVRWGQEAWLWPDDPV